jgi:hypothetical protein
LLAVVPVRVIRQICEADYGRDVDAHFAGVRALIGGAWVNGAPPWCPREVLELERWGEDDHLRRLFACALLAACLGYEEKDSFFLEGGIETLWRLADSAIVLGGVAPRLALKSWLDEEEARAREELGATGLWLAGLSEHGNGREYRHHWVWE